MDFRGDVTDWQPVISNRNSVQRMIFFIVRSLRQPFDHDLPNDSYGEGNRPSSLFGVGFGDSGVATAPRGAGP